MDTSAIIPLDQFEAATVKLLQAPSRFGTMMWSERRRPRKRQQYIVDGWFTDRGVAFIGGPSSSGKSFFAQHAGMCIARGIDFFDYPVRQCGVVYQAGEGGLGFTNRMDAYAIHFQVPDDEDVPFALIPSKINIFNKESTDVSDFIEEVKKVGARMSVPLGLVVIDTYSKATPGADEISGKDTSIILSNIERIRDECGVNVMVVHHMNAEGKKMRGHTSIRDNADQVVLITHDKETGIREAILDKQKDGEDGRRLRFTLASVPVATEGDKEITSCVVLTVSEKERLKKEQARQGLSVNPTERRILMNLFDTIDRHGKFVASDKDGPKAAIGKTVVEWPHYVEVGSEKLIDEEQTEAGRSKAKDRIRKEFNRGKDGLIKYGIIGLKSPHMWWDGKPIKGFPRTFPKKQIEDNYGTDVGQIRDNLISPGMAEVFESGGEVVF